MEQKKFSSLDNALRILELFSVEKPDYSVREVAEQLSIGDSTAHRLLTTLQKEGFITEDNRYNRNRLGVSIRAIESVIREDLPLYNVSNSILSSQVIKVGEIISLCVLHRDQTFYINTVEPESNQMIYTGLTYIGKRQPVLSTSAGKILLCNKSMDEVQRITSIQANSLDSLMEELQKIKERGYDISYNNFSAGITSISASVKNRKGEIIAAVEVIGPEQRISQGSMHRYIKQLKETATEIEKKLDPDHPIR